MALKRRSLSMEDKLKLLSEIDKAPKMKKTDLARIFNLPTSTLTTIVNNRKVIEGCAKKMCGRLSSRKKWKSSPFRDVELVLLAWIKQCCAVNIPLNGCLIREKALVIAHKLGLNNFTASNGWLDRFKNRYGVIYTMKKSSTCSSDESMTSSEWRNEHLLALIEGYDAKNIYNADETGFFFNLLIEGSCHDVEDYQDSDDRDDRLTVLLCANSDGSDKLPPLVVGKSKHPRSFKNFKTLACKYVENSNAWVTTTIFEDYLSYIDDEMEAVGRKILLFVDHCASHPPNAYLQNVKVVFFPSNCSSEVQPLSLGVIDAFKQNYRKTFEHNSELINSKYGPLSSKVELIEAMQFIVMSWDEVKTETIRSCFFKVGFPMVNCDSTLSCTEDTTDDIKTIDPNNTIPTCGIQTIEELCNQLLLQDMDTDSDERVVPSSDVSFDEHFHKDQDSIEEPGSQTIDKEMDSGDNDDVEQNPPNFETALNGFKIYKQYVCSFNIDEDMQNTLLLMEIALYKLHSMETLRSKLGDGKEKGS